MNPDLTAHLRSLEEQLLDPAFRRDRSAVSALLADTFLEFGSSGRIFTKAQILDLLAAESPVRFELHDFAAHTVAPDVALVTYRATRHTVSGPAVVSLRSSLWVRREGRWQMLFHQGTPTTPPAAR